jgi:glycosyltransferase involved in cell wall biosynthesis
MEIRIFMIIGLYYPVIGGAERECQNHAESFHKMGHKVMVLTQYVKGLPELEIINGVSVYRTIKPKKPWAITYLLSVLRFMIKKRNEYDVIQCYGIFYYTTASVIMKYIYKKKVINRLESAGQKGDLTRINTMKYGFLVKLSWRKVDKLIAISREVYNDLINCGVHKKKIIYIPNSVDTEYYIPPTSKSWDSPINILFVGRLTEEKGVNILLHAIKQVVEKGFNDLSLTIAGDGPLRGELEEMVNDLAITKYVRFAGIINNVIQYYHNSHVLVIPSNSEGFPLVLLEGMACGLAIVASNLGGNREGIEDGINGLLFAPRNETELSSKIIYFLEHPETAKQMGRISREKAVGHFSLRTNMQKYIELYKSLLAQ